MSQPNDPQDLNHKPTTTNHERSEAGTESSRLTVVVYVKEILKRSGRGGGNGEGGDGPCGVSMFVENHEEEQKEKVCMPM